MIKKTTERKNKKQSQKYRKTSREIQTFISVNICKIGIKIKHNNSTMRFVFNTDIKIQTNNRSDTMINTKYENMEKKEYVSNKIVEKKKAKYTHTNT